MTMECPILGRGKAHHPREAFVSPLDHRKVWKLRDPDSHQYESLFCYGGFLPIGRTARGTAQAVLEVSSGVPKKRYQIFEWETPNSIYFGLKVVTI